MSTPLGINEHFIIIYTGAHGVANNLNYVLEAAKILTNENVIFLFIGDGNKKAVLLEQVKSEKINNIKFLDPIPKNRLFKYISMADVGLATLKSTNYLKTTYPNKVFDYMACKIPCIIAIDGVIRNLVESSNAGMFSNPDNPNSLVESILKIKRMKKPFRDQMGENGYKTIVNSFNRDDCNKNLIDLLIQ